MSQHKDVKMNVNFDFSRHPILFRWIKLNQKFVMWCLRNDPDAVITKES